MEFVTGHAGTDHISAADMAALYRGLLIQDDVVLDSGNKLACTMLDANTAEIDTGDCMLQAHHARVEVAEQLEVRSGSNGYNRNDLIVARYTLGTGNIQSIYLAVVEGTAVAGEAEDPTYATGSIDGGTTLVEFPLWRIPITGVNVGTPERIMPTILNMGTRIDELENLVNKATTTQGGWTVRNLPNGYVEVSTDVSTNIMSWTAWGNIYEATMSNAIAYPIEFATRPNIRIEPFRVETAIMGFEIAGHSGSEKTEFPKFYALKATSTGTGIIGVTIYAKGKV